MKCLRIILLLIGCMLSALCRRSPAAAVEPAPVRVSVTASTRPDAISKAHQQAVVTAYQQAASALGQTPDSVLETKLLQQRDRWIVGHEIEELKNSDRTVQLTLAVTIDREKLLRYLLHPTEDTNGRPSTHVATTRDALRRPNLVIALAPRWQGDLTQAATAEQRTVLFETLNAAIGEAFSQARIPIVKPDWVDQELTAFRTATTGRERVDQRAAADSTITLRRNIRYRAGIDMDVEYALVGTMTLEPRETGGQYTVSLGVAGEIVTTKGGSPLAEPVHLEGAFKGATLNDTTRLGAGVIGSRLATSKAIPSLLANWQDRLASGTEYRLYIFYDNREFAMDILQFLKANGEVLPIENRDANLMAVRYRTKDLQPAMLTSDVMLELAFHDLKGRIRGEFQIRSSQGEIYFAPRTEKYTAILNGVTSGARYILKEYEAGGHDDGLPPALTMQKIAARLQKAVGVVMARSREGAWSEIATAWGVRPGIWASNAHVTEEVIKLRKAGAQVCILQNMSEAKAFNVTRAVSHSRFRKCESGLCYDVGLIFTDGADNPTIPIASQERLNGLTQGEPLLYLGFPAENLAQENLNYASPIATMQTGIVTAMSDFELRNVPGSQCQMIRHNLPATGGASGSPLINRFGEAVGALNGINTIVALFHVTDPQTGQDVIAPDRSPSAAGINFGQRADLILDLLSQAN